MSIGEDHSLFLNNIGEVFAYGRNDVGQLGLYSFEYNIGQYGGPIYWKFTITNIKDIYAGLEILS